MPEFGPKNRDSSVPGQDINPGALVRVSTVGEALAVESLREKFKDLPEEGFSYMVEFALVDVTSDQFLRNPEQLPNLWGEDAPRSSQISSLVFTRSELTEYFSSSLPEKVADYLGRGIPVGVRIIAWETAKGNDPNVVEHNDPQSVSDIANIILVKTK